MGFDDLQAEARVPGAIGARLARLRVVRSLTQPQLGDEAGVSKRTIERAESEPETSARGRPTSPAGTSMGCRSSMPRGHFVPRRFDRMAMARVTDP